MKTTAEDSIDQPTLAGAGKRRGIYMVLSASALPYAEKAFDSMFRHSTEPLALTLVTDGADDKIKLEDALAQLDVAPRHSWKVHAQSAADEIADDRFRAHPNLRQFRFGHPCWRKITDPMLFADAGEELIVLDPDLYFPNFFSFEPTAPTGVRLMWQPPSCLLPDEVVMRAFNRGIRLAHHVDIGVAQLRNDVDLDWLDSLVDRLGGSSIPRVMHVEAIVWAALAMQSGGGYFDPSHWYCWQYRQWKRALLKLGISGLRLLAMENLANVKCFHASGIAKWWIRGAVESNILPHPRDVNRPPVSRNFEELTLSSYKLDRSLKNIARRLGYYAIMKS